MEIVIVYLAAGAIAGLVAGLLGVGGGLIIVPVLAMIFSGQGMSGEIVMHLAIGTSLATIVITGLSATYTHHRHQAVWWPLFWRLSPGLMGGAILGSYAVDYSTDSLLRIFYGIFTLFVAIYMVLDFKPAPHRELPKSSGLMLGGLVIGTISTLVGIGGGTMTVPFLAWCRVPFRNAVAVSSACGLPIALMGTAGLMLTGWNNTLVPQGSSGYIYWPAFAGIAATSVATAPLGAKLAHRLPVNALKKLFAVLLIFVAIRMLIM